MDQEKNLGKRTVYQGRRLQRRTKVLTTSTTFWLKPDCTDHRICTTLDLGAAREYQRITTRFVQNRRTE